MGIDNDYGSGFKSTCPHCSKPIDDVIPKERFDRVYEERKTLKAQVSEFEKQAKSADKIAAKLEASEKALETERNKNAVDLGMLKIQAKHPTMTDDELAAFRETAEWKWGGLPADGRQPFLETVTSWMEKPDEAPPAVRALMPKAQAQAPTPGQHPANGAAPRPAFARHTNGLEGSGSSQPFQPGSLRAKRAAGTLTQQDIDQAMAAVTGQPPQPSKAS